MNTMSYAKAVQYAKYRLPYSAEAVRFVIERAGVSEGAVADIGAGTGLLTQHFPGQVARVYAVEPENTLLPDRSVDLIVAANSYHRFQPEEALKEFGRILKPGGWLAVFFYYDEFNFLQDNMNVGSSIEQYTTS